ncbi:MAG: DnrP protein [Oceanospirillaceae bacterium]|nr:DnrP protein [Oceanospirillaceae bacterium]MCP5334467.1 DnrP protein [Oceanospirillaceae bacterium]MCP5350825.1 DnrP protein [Oceanospirillaceae bacterium]
MVKPYQSECFYCHHKNDQHLDLCPHCGMPRLLRRPWQGRGKQVLFQYWFWLVVVFCLVMVVWLPRTIH